MIFDVLWPLPLVALAIYIWRETVAYRRETRAEHPELRVQAALGYARRPDHPWANRPLNPNTPPGCGDLSGTCGEPEFEGVREFIG